MTFKCHVWLSEGISVNYNCKSGRRCHLDQLAGIDSVAWADDRWGCSSGISAVFLGEDIGTWWTWPHLIPYVWRLFGSILKECQLYCWLLAIPIHEPSIRPATTWGLQISRWWRKTWTKLRLFAVAKVQGHQTDGASQSYWKVKPACKAVQTTHIPIHFFTLLMTPKVEFKVYPHVSHVSHVRVSKRLRGYSQPSQAVLFLFYWLFHPNHQHCKA